MSTQGHAIIEVDARLLETLFHLPDGYTIIRVSSRDNAISHNGRPEFAFVLASDAFPVTPEGMPLPRCQIWVHQDVLRWHPDYKRIEVEVKLP